MSDNEGLRRAAEAATPGPWVAMKAGSFDWAGAYWAVGTVADGYGERATLDEAEHLNAEADATYIAATSPDVVLGLLDEVEALRETVEAARKAHDPEEFECGRLGLPCTSVNDSGSYCRACRLRTAFRMTNAAGESA